MLELVFPSFKEGAASFVGFKGTVALLCPCAQGVERHILPPRICAGFIVARCGPQIAKEGARGQQGRQQNAWPWQIYGGSDPATRGYFHESFAPTLEGEQSLKAVGATHGAMGD
jgi:hypothetical protein